MLRKSGIFVVVLMLLSSLLANFGCTVNSEDSVLGVEVIEEVLPFFDKKINSVRYPQDGDKFLPMRVLLSRGRFWALSIRLRGILREQYPLPDRTLKYSVNAPDGTEFIGGSWQIQQPEHTELSETAPEGIYQLTVLNSQKLVVPVVREIDVPEVMIFSPGEEVLLGSRNNQLWFFVPKETKQFRVEIPLNDGHNIRRMSVWNSDGQRVWDLNYHRETYKGEYPVVAVIKVEPQQTGKLWRITLPGTSARFSMDPQIPPVYSTARDRWFMPENKTLAYYNSQKQQ